MLSSMTKGYIEDRMIEESNSSENVVDDDLSDIDSITEDVLMVENLLEHAKHVFLEQ